MRVHHYIKNLLVFAALACSGQLLVWDRFLAGLAGFAAFCMASSAVYILNDIRDRNNDRLHPVKCRRPLASGAVSIKGAAVLLGVLLLAAAGCSGFVWNGPLPSLLLALYFLLNLAYSFGLKNIPVVDISILVSGFLIRAVYGAAVTGIPVSNWLYLTVIAASFYFALGKRRNELKKSEGGETRRVLQAYPMAFLDKSMYMCLALANTFYALWSMDESTIALYDNAHLIFTVPLVLLITLKYSMTIEGESDGDPVEVLLHDPILLGLCTVYLVMMLILLYL